MMQRLLAALSLAALAPLSSGQSLPFLADQAQSNYTWSGTTSIGALVGDPSDMFQLAGSVTLDLDAGGNPVSAGQWLATDLLVTPDLSGHIPNPLSFLPPLAILDVANLRFSIASDPFAVDGAGNFSTTTILTVISGILTVTPLTGGSTVTDLAGTVGPATITPGTITESAGTLLMVSPMVTQFQFTDPTSNISATLSLNGTLVASYDCPTPVNFCTTSPNSAGTGATIDGLGSTSITANDLMLRAVGCPANKPGLFFYGLNEANTPLGNGTLCLSGQVRRLGVNLSSATGEYQAPFDHTTLAASDVIEPGDTRRFQCWFRDPAGGGLGFNLSDGLSVTFCP